MHAIPTLSRFSPRTRRAARRLALWLCPGSPLLASAADCPASGPGANPGTATCADRELADLDTRLQAADERARAADPAASQRADTWRVEVRDRCTSRDCLFQAYAQRIETLRREAIRCPITATDLVGRWEHVDGNGPDAVMLSETGGERRFESTGDGEQTRAGRWQFRDCQLMLQDDEESYGYDVHDFSQGRLRLEDLDEHESLVLRRAAS